MKLKNRNMYVLLFLFFTCIMKLVSNTKTNILKKNIKEDEMNENKGTVLQRKESAQRYILNLRDKFQRNEIDEKTAAENMILGLNIDKIPVNVWEIARMLGLEVLEANFKNNNVSGSIIVSEEIPEILKKFNTNKAIILNKEESFDIQAFTIAHELGHYVMDITDSQQFFENYHISKERGILDRKGIEFKKREDRADKFAAILLMPEEYFIEYYNNSINKNTDDIYKEMASKFMVPLEAVKRRFKELNIRNYSVWG